MDAFLQVHPPAPSEQVSTSPLETASHRCVPPCQGANRKDFSKALLSLRHSGRLFPIFPLQYELLAARVVQDKACEKMAGCSFLAGEGRGTMEDGEGGGQGMQNYRRRSWEASKGNLKRWDVRENFCSCVWTNQEHRGVSGHQHLQLRCRHGNGWFCR